MLPLKDENPTSRTPVITFIIIAVCIFIFVIPQGMLADLETANEFTLEYAAIPCEIATSEPLSEAEIAGAANGNFSACFDGGSSPERYPNKIVYFGIISSMFLHGSFLHLAGNMWSFWIFGNNIEDRLGSLWFSIFYLIGGIVATLAHYIIQPDSTIPVIGASGAIAAVMGAYIVWFPDAPIKTIFFFRLMDVRAKWFLGFWFITQFIIIGDSDSGIAWMAHVGGFVFGAFVGLIVRSGFGRNKISHQDDFDHWDTTGGIGKGPLKHPLENRNSNRGIF